MTHTSFKLSIDPPFFVSMRPNVRHTQFSFEIAFPTVVITKSTNFYDVTQCSLVEISFYLQGLEE
jgi:hypothetical protein